MTALLIFALLPSYAELGMKGRVHVIIRQRAVFPEKSSMLSNSALIRFLLGIIQ
jgi:hypothetical protein